MSDLKTLLPKALAAFNKGLAAEAVQFCRQALAANPNAFDALHILAASQSKLGQHEAALATYNRAVALQPRHAEALSGRAFVLLHLKQHEEAAADYDRAIAQRPGVAIWFYNRGNALRELKRFDAALESYDQATKLRPELAEAHLNAGNILKDLSRHDEAIAAYERALAARPGYADALWNHGRTLAIQERPAEALAKFDEALASQPDHVQALWSRGHTLKTLGRYGDEQRHYAGVFKTLPDHVGMRINHAVTSLLLGDFAGGFAGYEWRKKDEGNWPYAFKTPPWTGMEMLEGKTVLLHHEQGLGDTIQFCRYGPKLAARGAQVILRVQPSLKELIGSLPGSPRIVSSIEPTPDHDFHCALLSLPLAFATRVNSIPSGAAYLQAPAQAIERWRPRLGGSLHPRIGLVWSGNPQHRNDRNRSVPLGDLVPLLKSGMSFVSLQKDLRQGDAEIIARHPNVLHLGGALKDFSDTAAIVAQLDLVITVDTSVAHLAGALGKPLWIMLPHVPDWRWLLERDDSPWYPTARLFRQDATRRWDGVGERMQSALETFVRRA